MGLITTFELRHDYWVYADRELFDVEEVSVDIMSSNSPFPPAKEITPPTIKVDMTTLREWLIKQPFKGKAWLSTIYCEDFDGEEMICELRQQLAFDNREDAMLFKLTFA